MSYREKLQQTLNNISKRKEEADTELQQLEDEFSNVKLNPYGVTSIDFSKRQELATDILKMEGTIMGLSLALETYDEELESVTS